MCLPRPRSLPRFRHLRSVARLVIVAVLAVAIVALAPLLAVSPSQAAGETHLAPTASANGAVVGAGRQIAYLGRSRPLGWRSRGHAYRPLGSGKLTWHSGPVQHHPTQYLIFWGPSWLTSSHTLVPVAQLVKQYFADMAGTPFERVVTQYGDHSGTIANTDTLAAVVVDSAPPTTDTSCGAQTIEDSAIMQEVAHAEQVFNWPAPSVDATYLVYTPPKYAINDGAGDCSTRTFCAYHAWSTTTPGFAYAAIPYPDDAGCEVPRSPNHDLAGDSLVSTSSHEQLEAITDPQVGTGWLDADSFELADKCATDFALGYTRLGRSDHYEMQAEYSNANRSCVNSYTPPPSPKITTTSHRHVVRRR